MSTTMIQIRNVPGDVHRKAKARAALAGLTLSEFALQALAREVAIPTLDEIAERIRLLGAVETTVTAAEIIRAERDGR